MLAQQVGGHWRQLRQRIWPARLPACCAKPETDHAVHAVERESLRSATSRPRGLSDPRVIEAFMNMRCC